MSSFAVVTALDAMVAENDPVPLPVTSPVSVIVWLPVFVPLTDAVPLTVNAPLPPLAIATPFTLLGVMAPRVRVNAGVAPPDDVPDTPLAVATETAVTVPPPPPPLNNVQKLVHVAPVPG